MKAFSMYLKGYSRASCRNPLVYGEDWITEIRFQEYVNEDGKRMVTVVRAYWVRKIENRGTSQEWQVDFSNLLCKSVTTDEANKIYLKFKKKGATTSTPTELVNIKQK